MMITIKIPELDDIIDWPMDLPPASHIYSIDECMQRAADLEAYRNSVIQSNKHEAESKVGTVTLDGVVYPARLVNAKNKKYLRRAAVLYRNTRVSICEDIQKRFKLPHWPIPYDDPIIRHDIPSHELVSKLQKLSQSRYKDDITFDSSVLKVFDLMMPRKYRRRVGMDFSEAKKFFSKIRTFIKRLDYLRTLYAYQNGTLDENEQVLFGPINLSPEKFRNDFTEGIVYDAIKFLYSVLLMMYYADNLDSVIDIVYDDVVKLFSYCDYLAVDFAFDLTDWDELTKNDRLINKLRTKIAPYKAKMIQCEDTYLPQFGFSRLKEIIGVEECERLFCGGITYAPYE